MKILFLAAEPPWPLDQGDKLRNFHLLKALAEENQITLVCFCRPGEENGAWRETLSPFCHRIYQVPLGRRRMLLNVLRLPHLPVTMAARASADMRRLLRRMTREERFDAAYACQLKTAGYLKHCSGVKKVADLTDAVSFYRRRMLSFAPSRLSRIFGAVEVSRLAFWERKAAKSADLTLLISPVDAELLRKRVPRANIAVLPNGVDIERFQPSPETGKPVLLFYGHLRYPPNKDGIVWFSREVFPFVRSNVPEAELVIIGKEAPPEVELLKQIQGVNLVGYVSDLIPHLHQAAAVVVPLRFGAGIRNKVLEGMAAGRPVVSTSLGCEGLEVTPGVHLEVADTPGSFAEAVIRLLQDPCRRTFLAANGRKFVEEKHSWRVMGERLCRLLKT